MPAGFEAYDEDGFPLVTVTTRLTKVLGVVPNTGISDGAFAIDLPSWGKVWTQVSSINGGAYFYVVPTASYSNGAIRWTFRNGIEVPPPNEYRAACRIVFGVY